MSRVLTIGNVYAKKHETFDFKGVWFDIFGKPERKGCWLIMGNDKNGKTTLALMLAEYISGFGKVLYISAEEGVGKDFVDACRRAKLNAENKNLKFLEYVSIEELQNKLDKRRSANVIIVDNITIYADELKNGVFRKLMKKYYNKKLFVFLAHMDRGEPYTATAKLCKRLAKVIIYVKGLACMVSGRVPGGTLMVDETKAKLFHGNEIE